MRRGGAAHSTPNMDHCQQLIYYNSIAACWTTPAGLSREGGGELAREDEAQGAA